MFKVKIPILQTMIDWCNQPAPPFVSDTHVMLFFLNSPEAPSILYQGYLFYKPGPVAGNPEMESHFFGTGYLLANQGFAQLAHLKQDSVPLCVRISIAISFGGDAVAGVNFFRNYTGDFNPTGESLGEVDVTEAPPFSGLSLSLGTWGLQVFQTTLTP
jgi:hypothetical protein